MRRTAIALLGALALACCTSKRSEPAPRSDLLAEMLGQWAGYIGGHLLIVDLSDVGDGDVSMHYEISDLEVGYGLEAYVEWINESGARLYVGRNRPGIITLTWARTVPPTLTFDHRSHGVAVCTR